MNHVNKTVLSLALGVSLFASTAQGSGFAIIEQSVSGLGSAFAGAAASAEDASTVFYNPAGMMKLGNQASLVGGLHFIQPSAEFSNTTSSLLSGGDGSDAGQSAVVPNAYYVGQKTGAVRFGLGIGAPFGMGTEYDSDWKGRYYAIKSELHTVNVNPAFAFQAHEKLAIGVGLNIQHATATLTSAVNVGGNGGTSPVGLCAYLSTLPIPGNPYGGCIGSADAQAEITGSSTSWGVNYGVLYDWSNATRIGFHYRSGVRHKLKGDADFTSVDPILSATGFLVNTDATASVNLPATAALSVSSAINDKMTLLADAMWTDWSQLSELRVEFDQGEQGDSVEELGWQNTGRYSVGMLYGLSDNLKLRAGVALDQSPTPNERRRSIRVPDADRTWLAVGLGYKLGNGMNLDAAFTAIAVDDAEVNKNENFKGNLVGDYEAGVNIFSVQASIPF